jgi:hypothetical protein
MNSKSVLFEQPNTIYHTCCSAASGAVVVFLLHCSFRRVKILAPNKAEKCAQAKSFRYFELRLLQVLADFHSIYSHGFIRGAVCLPHMRVADSVFNTKRTLALAQRGAGTYAVLALLELGVSGYSNEDLLHQNILLDATRMAVARIVEASARPCASRANSSTGLSSSIGEKFSGLCRRRICPTIESFTRSGGPKGGSGGSLSPRGDWCAPSDAEAIAWQDEVRSQIP